MFLGRATGVLMTFYTCAALAVLLIVGFAGAMLPFVSVWDHRLAAARRRSLYDKAAGQTESFTAALQIILALALGADLLAGGWINRLMTGPWAFVWECLVIASAVAALCAAAVLFVRRAGKMAFGVLSGLAATLSSCLLCVLAWGFCLGALTAGTGNEEEAVQSFLVLMAGLHSLGFVFFAAFSLFLGLTSAYALALCWHILCRNRDDFGRDYYTFTLSMRARQAFCAGLLLTVSAAAMFWLTPVVDAEHALALLPFAGVYASHALTAGMFCLPLAALLWYAVSRATLPMQKRSLAFLAVILLAVGVYFVLARV